MNLRLGNVLMAAFCAFSLACFQSLGFSYNRSRLKKRSGKRNARETSEIYKLKVHKKRQRSYNKPNHLSDDDEENWKTSFNGPTTCKHQQSTHMRSNGNKEIPARVIHLFLSHSHREAGTNFLRKDYQQREIAGKSYFLWPHACGWL